MTSSLDNPTEFVRPFGAFDPGRWRDQHDRRKASRRLRAGRGRNAGRSKWEAGVRYETTDLTIVDLTAAGDAHRQ